MEDFGYLITLIKHYGYWVITVGILLECMGVPFPGETVLILGGVAASLGHLNLITVIVLAALSAVLGDNLGYLIGKKFGRKIIKKFEHFPLFHYSHINRAENFFKKHGNKTVFIGRFTALLRTYAALLSGVFDMHYPTFFFYNLSGGILWAITFGLVGFLIGNNLPLLSSIIRNFNIGILVIVGSFIAYKVIKMFWRKKHHAQKTSKEEKKDIEPMY